MAYLGRKMQELRSNKLVRLADAYITKQRSLSHENIDCKSHRVWYRSSILRVNTLTVRKCVISVQHQLGNHGDTYNVSGDSPDDWLQSHGEQPPRP